jgi:hypothetical protein
MKNSTRKIFAQTITMINAWKALHLDPSLGNFTENDLKEISTGLISVITTQRKNLGISEYREFASALRHYINNPGYYPKAEYKGWLGTSMVRREEFNVLDDMLANEVANAIPRSNIQPLSTLLAVGLIFSTLPVAAAEHKISDSKDLCFNLGNPVFTSMNSGPLHLWRPELQKNFYEGGIVCRKNTLLSERNFFNQIIEVTQFQRLEMFVGMIGLVVNTKEPKTKLMGLVDVSVSVNKKKPEITLVNQALEAFLTYAKTTGYEQTFDELIATSFKAARKKPVELLNEATSNNFHLTAAALRRGFPELANQQPSVAVTKATQQIRQEL